MEILLIIVVGILVLAGLAWLGFLLPAPVKTPLVEHGDEELALRHLDSLPADCKSLMIEYFREGVPIPETIVAWGNARIVYGQVPVIGSLWAPLTWTLYLKPGKGFIWKIGMTWFRKVRISGGDGYLDGKGKFHMGDTVLENPNLDRGERTMLWLYTLLLAPGSMFVTPGVSCEKNDQGQYLVKVSEPETEVESFNIIVSPTVSLPSQVDTHRAASKDGRNLPFNVRIEQYFSPFPGWNFPAELVFSWENDAYLKMSVKGIQFNVHIENELSKGI
ncbi:MAG TPA: hypothetical protein VIO61_09405 [Anaerolineaceae bacterium]